MQRPSFTSFAALLALVISLANAFNQTGHAQGVPQAVTGSAFTYQGRLDNNGAPANGAYDFEFALFDSATVGNQLGATVALNGVNVVNGVFTVQLDFGNPFWQQQTYLEVRVRQSGGGSFTTLTPRQLLTAVPVARSLPGVYVDQANQFVGIGRSTQIVGREVFGINADFGADDVNYGGMYVNTVAARGLPFYGYATNGGFRAWTTYNPNPNNEASPDLNNGAWELYTASVATSRPLLQVRPGSVAQPLSANGLVKAGAFVNCSLSTPSISRSFVNIVTPSPAAPPAVTVTWNSTLDACVIDFGFNITSRYYVATANAANPRVVVCAYASLTSLYCKRFQLDGTRENGNISVLIY